MSKSQRLKNILDRAKGKEKRYDWLEAAELYGQALSVMVKADFLRKGEIQQRIGYCYYRAAFQAKVRKEFERSMRLSAKAYEDGSTLFDRLKDPKNQARMNFCKALTSYSKSRLAEDSTERKALLDECRKLQKETVKTYEKTGDKVAFGKACNELLTCLYDRFWLMHDWQEGMNILEGATKYGEKAIAALSEARGENKLALAYAMCSAHYFWLSSMQESIEKQKELVQKCLTYAQKALETSETTGDSYLIAMSNWVIAWSTMDYAGDLESGLRHAEKMLELGTILKDSFIISMASGALAYSSLWKMQMEEDPDKRRSGLRKATQYGDGTNLAHLISSLIPSGFMAHIDSYCVMALDAISPEERRVLLEKAVEVGRKHLEHARRWHSLLNMGYVLHPLSKALLYLSALETKKSEKRRLLEEASKYREETINLFEQATPFDYWNRGVMYSYSALVKAELAKIEMNSQKKEDLLRKAVVDMEDGMKLCTKGVKRTPQVRLFAAIGAYQDQFGGILHQLYSVTGEKRNLERAVTVYADSVRAWEKSDLHSRIAETHWKMAKLYDLMGEHSKAAHEFKSASERYKLAAEKLPPLKAFCTDYAVYMQAWEEIERARQHHAEKQYGQAQEYYEKAATLHEETDRWRYLGSNYLALARFEEAEGLSRKEQAEAAQDLFRKAAKLFSEAKGSIEVTLEKIEVREEREMAAELAKASGVREEYCLGRIALEEAKILDRQGDHTTSSEKYGLAAEKFQRVTDAMEHESDRQELEPIVDLCRAWQKMTQAEAEALPDLYLEASKLFGEAKEHALDERAKVLALGHSSFCKALEAGTRFEATADMEMYSTAKKHLEASAKYYLKAGFKNAADYAEATNMLFDAYMYMNKAETETEPRKKAQYYRMAEKLLQASGGSYMQAKHPEKSEQVQRLLEGIREKKQLAMSLTEVLHAPTTTSTTTSFSMPAPTREQAVGLERFEHADIQANLILRVKEVKVDEDVEFRVELVNAGKGPALLIKVDEVVPEGFEIKQVPETYLVEDSFINMKGKRLNPLRTEDVKVVAKPRSKGTFTVKPRVLYIDETGKYKSHEPEPVTVTVKELGIKGWIKGER